MPENSELKYSTQMLERANIEVKRRFYVEIAAQIIPNWNKKLHLVTMLVR